MIEDRIDGAYIPSSLPEELAGLHPRTHTILSLYDMLRFYAESYLSSLRIIESATRLIKSGMFLTKKDAKDIVAALAELEHECGQLNLTISLAHIKRIRKHTRDLSDRAKDMTDEDLTRKELKSIYSELEQLFVELQNRVIDELGTQYIFSIPSTRKAYFEDQQFAQSVVDRYQGAVDEMLEAGKCFALERYTACVFHLMRTTEAGLNSLGAFVLPDEFSETEPIPASWNKILGKINQLLKKPPTDWPQGKHELLSEISAHMHAVNKAWRNDTMHLKSVYTSEMALEIFNATKGLMRYLAEHLTQ
ncbi:MAG: hypothetical protein IH975_09295 [Nitrospinae bacterium]|nr:hypothetical protein [Nitrospinota bacterium]